MHLLRNLAVKYFTIILPLKKSALELIPWIILLRIGSDKEEDEKLALIYLLILHT